MEEEEEEEGEPKKKGNVKPGGPCYVCWLRGECLAAVHRVFLVWSLTKFGLETKSDFRLHARNHETV